MTDTTRNAPQEPYKGYEKLHLKEDQRSLPADEKITILQKKNRSQWWKLAINVAAICFFGYSFYFGITQMSDIVLYILLAVFGVNVGLIFYQKKQIRQLIKHLETQAGV